MSDNTEIEGSKDIVTVPINNIKPYNNNPRFNAKSIVLLEEAIKRYGFLVPITVDSDYVIITGHSRYTAARNIGLTELPTIVLSDLSERQVREYRIADNKVAEHSQLDYTMKASDLDNYAENDELMQYAFPDFAPAKDEEPEDEEEDNELPEVDCICPSCLHEFDANNAYPFPMDNQEEE